VKKVIFFYLFLEILIFWGCSDLQDECALQVGSQAAIENLKARNIEFNAKNSIVLLNENDTISNTKFAIWLDVTPRFVSYNSIETSVNNNRSIGFRQLMACSSLQSPELLEFITDIKVYAASDSGSSPNDRIPLDFEFFIDNGFSPYDDIELLNESLKKDLYLFMRPIEINPDTLNQFRIEIKTIYNKDYFLNTEPVFITD